MAIAVQTGLLKEALGRVMPFVAKKGYSLPPRNVLLCQQADVLEIRATDLETFARTTISLLGERPGATRVSLGVPPKELMSLLKSLPPDSSLTLEQITPENLPLQLKITSAFGIHTLPGIPAEEYPNFSKPGGTHHLTILAPTLREIFEKTAFAAADDSTRLHLSGIYIHFLSDRTNFVGTDARILSRLSHSQIVAPDAPDVILPIDTVRAFLKASQIFAPEDDITIALSSVEIAFLHPKLEVLCKVREGHYPDYQSIITNLNSPPHTAHINRNSLKKSLERLILFASDKHPQITLSFSSSSVALSAKNIANHNAATETLPCEYRGDPAEIHFWGPQLINIVRHISSENITMRITAPNKPVLIEPAPQKPPTEILCLIMPVIPT